MKLTEHFTLSEMTASQTAREKRIKNEPDQQAVVNLMALCLMVLEPLRIAMNEPIKIGSGYRSQKLNKAVGGVANSQHMTGQAADLCIDGDMAKGRRWFQWIRTHCTFDQLIFEHNAKGSYWVHVSYNAQGRNRMQVIEDLLKNG